MQQGLQLQALFFCSDGKLECQAAFRLSRSISA
jgi:hypothetical protein